MASQSTNPQTPVRKITWGEFNRDVRTLMRELTPNAVYGIPTGGCFVANRLAELWKVPLLDAPEPGCLVVDDIQDSGRTLAPYIEQEKYTLATVYRKPHAPYKAVSHGVEVSDWIQFPWEHDATGPEDAVIRLLEYIGEDPTRDGLKDTPKRVAKAWREITEGYRLQPEDILSTVFDDIPAGEPITLSGIEFYSTCEHHLLPFYGVASVTYHPDKKVVGLSKLARIVLCYARRLQVQERLTEQIAQAVYEHLQPKGVYVQIEAKHMCMACRGVHQPNAVMTTQARRGEYTIYSGSAYNG